MLADSVFPVIDAGLATFAESDAQITDEVRFIASPGHSPGHMSIMIESQGERAVITGDVMHHPCQLARPEWSSTLDFDQAASRAMRRAFLEQFADVPVLFIGTHFPPPVAGRLVRSGGRLPTRVTHRRLRTVAKII